jgi:hypothetical protein
VIIIMLLLYVLKKTRDGEHRAIDEVSASCVKTMTMTIVVVVVATARLGGYCIYKTSRARGARAPRAKSSGGASRVAERRYACVCASSF